MSITRYLLVLSALLPLSAITSAPTIAAPAKSVAKTKVITKNDINTMLQVIEKAANRKDINPITALMAPDVVVKMTVPGQPTMVLNFEQYKEMTAQAFAAVEDYEYKRLSAKIFIAANGKAARVVTTVQEKMTINGQSLKGVSRITSRMEVRGNRILCTAMTGTANFSTSTEI